ncbi:hypothetical protein F4804DRAFT_331080 [Jackrogersella minutella]|nr:hypothetical protein F4804DRAFT_331080 [Jackrogersella minutella]
MPDSELPSEKVEWHEVVLKQKYNDPLKLKKSLDGLYGQGKYKVRTKANRYILQLPEKIHEEKKAEIEAAIRFHYNG